MYRLTFDPGQRRVLLLVLNKIIIVTNILSIKKDSYNLILSNRNKQNHDPLREAGIIKINMLKRILKSSSDL